MDEVFAPQQMQTATQEMRVDDKDRPWGGEGVLRESMSATQQRRDAPVLKKFERLSLLEK